MFIDKAKLSWSSLATNFLVLRVWLGTRTTIPWPSLLQLLLFLSGLWANASSKTSSFPPRKIRPPTFLGLLLIQCSLSVLKRVVLYSLTVRVRERFLALLSMERKCPMVTGTKRDTWWLPPRIVSWPCQTTRVTPSTTPSSSRVRFKTCVGVHTKILTSPSVSVLLLFLPSRFFTWSQRLRNTTCSTSTLTSAKSPALSGTTKTESWLVLPQVWSLASPLRKTSLVKRLELSTLVPNLLMLSSLTLIWLSLPLLCKVTSSSSLLPTNKRLPTRESRSANLAVISLVSTGPRMVASWLWPLTRVTSLVSSLSFPLYALLTNHMLLC